MGMPSVMTTDQDTEFHNDLNKELMQVFGIKHHFTTAFHPPADIAHVYTIHEYIHEKLSKM